MATRFNKMEISGDLRAALVEWWSLAAQETLRKDKLESENMVCFHFFFLKNSAIK